MIDAEEYKRILTEHGRRVANRVAFASVPREERAADGLGGFCDSLNALYGPEESLPPHERMRKGEPARYFDPMGWLALYSDHPAHTTSLTYHLTEGASKRWFEQWADWLSATSERWGKWVIDFIFISLVLGESHEFTDSIADDQGEFVLPDEYRFCGWYPGWKGWTHMILNLTDDELEGLKFMVTRYCTKPQTHRWPNPGTPEAEALIAEMKEGK
jgi:hypothetical protein